MGFYSTGLAPPCTGTNVLLVTNDLSASATDLINNLANVPAVAASAAAAQTTANTALTTANTIATTIGAGASSPSGSASGTVSVTPYVATVDDYTALSSVFGLVLVAAAITWGLKQVYNTIANHAES